MRKYYFIFALLITFSNFCYADNYDSARKIYEMGKEVESYQKAKMDGTYVDYSVTPTWVKVLWSSLGIFVVGFGLFGVYASMSGKSGPKSSKDIKIKEKQISETSEIKNALNKKSGGDYIEQITCKSIEELRKIAQTKNTIDDFWSAVESSIGIKPFGYSFLSSSFEKFPQNKDLAIAHTFYHSLYKFFHEGKKKNQYLPGGIDELIRYQFQKIKNKEYENLSIVKTNEAEDLIKNELTCEINQEKGEIYLEKALVAAEILLNELNIIDGKLSFTKFYREYTNELGAPVFSEIRSSLRPSSKDKFITDKILSNAEKFKNLNFLIEKIQEKIKSDADKSQARKIKKSQEKSE